MWENKDLPKFGPLQGVKVAMAAVSTSGPLVGCILGEFGADVLWLENTRVSDVTRRNMTRLQEASKHNMRNMALNIPSPDGREIFLEIIKDADVFIESYKGGQMEKWGLTDEVLWEVNPKLVICHISGYGQTGDPDYIGRPAYDAIAQAFSGYTARQAPTGQAPYPVGPYLADYVAAYFGVIGIMFSLFQRERTGKGDSVDIAQFEVMLKLGFHHTDWFTDHNDNYPTAGDLPTFCGWGCWPCSDGAYVQTCIVGPGPMSIAVPFFGFEYGSEDFPTGRNAYYGTPAGDKFHAALLEFCASRTADEVVAEMSAVGLPVAKVNTFADLEYDPHVLARGVIEEFDNLNGDRIRTARPQPPLKNNPGKIVMPAPAWGQHNEEVLRSLGYTEDQIEALYDKEVIVKGVQESDYRYVEGGSVVPVYKPPIKPAAK